MTMKLIPYILTILCASIVLPVAASSNAADTVIIELGNNTRIITYVQDAEGLKELENYDLNAMLKDLNLSIDSSNCRIFIRTI